MDRELEQLIERARDVKLTEQQLEDGRVAIAAANGAITDSRITLETMRATRTIVLASEAPRDETDCD